VDWSKVDKCRVKSPTELTTQEGVKFASNLLGKLLEDLAAPFANLKHRDEHLLSFTGFYAQDKREVCRERSLAGETLESMRQVASS